MNVGQCGGLRHERVTDDGRHVPRLTLMVLALLAVVVLLAQQATAEARAAQGPATPFAAADASVTDGRQTVGGDGSLEGVQARLAAACGCSQNGWPASADPAAIGVRSFTVPGSSVSLKIKAGDVSTVLLYVASRFHREIEPLQQTQSAGYVYRPISGSSVLSNHASGTAVDFNWGEHPQTQTGTFTAAQEAVIRDILAVTGGVVRWGGDYRTTPDEMHFEINVPPGDPTLTRVAAQLEGGGRAGGHAVVADRSGRVWSFAIKQDGTLYYRYTATGGWSGWQMVGTGYASVAATIDGTGRVWTLVTRSNGELRYRRTVNPATATTTGSGWGAWSAPQGAGDWDVVSASTAQDGRVWIAATKTYGALYYRHQNATGGWEPFVEAGTGSWTSVSTTVETDTGKVWLFATKSNGDLYYRYTLQGSGGGWSGFTEYGNGGWAGDVTATSESGRVWAFTPKTDGTLYYRYTTAAGWSTFQTVGAGGWATVSATSRTATGPVWMFATKTTGDLYYRYGSTTSWGAFTTAGTGQWK